MTNTGIKLKPFLKWAGGKSQLVDRLRSKMPDSYNKYYEPFLGGGAMLLDIMPRDAVVNDINASLLNVYTQIREDCDGLITKLRVLDSITCNKQRYDLLKDEYNRKILAGELDLDCAALMIWINKHCFNGLYRVNKSGEFNVSYNNKDSISSFDPDNIRMISEYLNSADIEIRHGDFEAACFDISAGDFVYFDSPYVPISETADFTSYSENGFKGADHERLAKLFRELDKRGAYLMLSNNDTQRVHDLYAGFNIESVPVRRNINSDASKRTGCEVIITNF